MALYQKPVPDFTLKSFDPDTGVSLWIDRKNTLWYMDQHGNNFADALVDEIYAQLRGIRTLTWPTTGVNKNG